MSPALDADGNVRDGAFVARLTGVLSLTGWPPGMRVIIRSERRTPTRSSGHRHRRQPGHHLRHQHPPRPVAETLELRHRRRVRCEDRIRRAKDTGLNNLPLHDTDQNRIWLAFVNLACEITAWLQMLAMTDHEARRWEPKRLRHRLFTTPSGSAAPPDAPPCTSPPAAPGPSCC